MAAVPSNVLHAGELVPWNRDDLHKLRSAAPVWRDATSDVPAD
jgi:hypothetical protein